LQVNTGKRVIIYSFLDHPFTFATQKGEPQGIRAAQLSPTRLRFLFSFDIPYFDITSHRAYITP
jgi:hypothetical protein